MPVHVHAHPRPRPRSSIPTVSTFLVFVLVFLHFTCCCGIESVNEADDLAAWRRDALEWNELVTAWDIKPLDAADDIWKDVAPPRTTAFGKSETQDKFVCENKNNANSKPKAKSLLILIQLKHKIRLSSSHTDLLDSRAHTNTDTDTKTQNTPHSAPLDCLSTTVPMIRSQARGGPDPTAPWVNSYELGQFSGRVVGAAFYVRLRGPRRRDEPAPNTGPSGAYCDALYNPLGYPNSASLENRWSIPGQPLSRKGWEYERGHIWGSELGGHDEDPLNFFPQHFLSNAHNSAWYRMERIAAKLKTEFEKLTAPIPVTTRWGANAPATEWKARQCPVAVYISFEYPLLAVAPRGHTPTGGRYEIRVPTECRNALYQHYITKRLAIPEYVNVFFNPATKAAGTQPQPESTFGYGGFIKFAGHALSTAWVNDIDVCVQQNPADLALPAVIPRDYATGYHACDHLYA